MINFSSGVAKIFGYFKNIIDSPIETDLTAVNRPIASKRNLTAFIRDGDTDNEVPLVEPPHKKSKYYTEAEFSTPALHSKLVNESHFYNIGKIKLSPSNEMNSSSYGDIAYLGSSLKHKTPKPAIDPNFKFNPSLCSTGIRNTEYFASIVKRRPIGKISISAERDKPFEKKITSMKSKRLQPLIEKKKSYMPSFPNFSKLIKMNKYNTPMQSHRLDERNTYKQLLQQYTSCSVKASTTTEFKLCLKAQSALYRKEEQIATSSGALKKSLMDPKWSEKKHLMLNQEASKGTPFPKETISVLEACSVSRVNGNAIPFIDLEFSRNPNFDDDIVITKELLKPKRKQSNSLENKLQISEFYGYGWLKTMQASNREKVEAREKDLEHAAKERNQWEQHRKAVSEAKLLDNVNKRISLLDIKYPIKFVEITEEEQLPELTNEIEAVIDEALRGGPGSEVLADKCNIQITRKDLHTLSGLNWLNDEVINFYMNLLMERSQNVQQLPNVYAFNTFFYSKLVKMGYTSVKRWTKKVDIFSYDLLLIPVHLGMHWCLATVDFRAKVIRYYDSMLGDNHRCLTELEKYLESEHRDKKKSPYDGPCLNLENVKDIPQQMNGSDCGMFSCKFAEYLSRDSLITFSQEHMPYFRRRMVYEIVSKTLM